MRLEKITAIPHPYGNRIDLKWVNPDPDQFPGVHVVRREGSYPTSPEDGVPVPEGAAPSSAVDKNLKGEVVYYYALIPYKGDPPEYQFDLHNRTTAMATAPYNMAGQMFELLPAIYHRYDTILPKCPLPPGMPEADQQRGQLRRFLDLPGAQLDQIQSFSKALLDLYHLGKVNGHLLPLLAQWIGWRSDFRQEIDAQRNEIRNAPSVYQRIGLIPTVEATVKRISGWESHTKEFVHNVFLSNRPERLNIWVRQRNNGGVWSEPTKPLSLNLAYEGRPASVRDGDGTLWLFYHTLKGGRWNIWYKTYREDRKERWTPSQPLTHNLIIGKHPSAVLHDGTLWVFWAAYDEDAGSWNLQYRKRVDNEWPVVDPDLTLPWGDRGHERKQPSAVTDDEGGLWLFWLEKEGAQWRMKYNRYESGGWGSSVSFPLEGGQDPRVVGAPFVLFHPAEEPSRRLWVFWARQEATGEPGQTRWTIVYRIKDNTDLNDTGWESIQSLSILPAEYHDREPAALVNVDGNIELFWSSNRDGGWSIWQRTLDIAEDTWGSEEQVMADIYSQRNPLPLQINEGLLLIYRSNKSLSYSSKVFGATETVDARYAGSTTVHTRNAAKIALRGEFDDFQTYTYDTGQNGEPSNDDWYARDTIGLYLAPDTMDAEKIDSGISRVRKVLDEFIPITDRAVFISQPDLHTDLVYTSGRPLSSESRFIAESYHDTLVLALEEAVPAPQDGFIDEVSQEGVS